MTFTLQLLSNLKLDMGHKILPKAVATNVALLGNCLQVESPTFRDWMYRFSSHWKNVYIVPGPYELSSKTGTPYWKLQDQLYDVQREFPNISIMNQLDIPLSKEKIVLFGTPLFQDTAFRHGLPCSNEEASIYAKKDQRIGTINLAQWHWEDKEWLKSRLCWYTRHSPDMKAVCLTSYSPFASEGVAPMISTRNGIVSWAFGAFETDAYAKGSVVFQIKNDLTTVYSVENDDAPILQLQ